VIPGKASESFSTQCLQAAMTLSEFRVDLLHENSLPSFLDGSLEIGTMSSEHEGVVLNPALRFGEQGRLPGGGDSKAKSWKMRDQQWEKGLSGYREQKEQRQEWRTTQSLLHFYFDGIRCQMWDSRR